MLLNIAIHIIIMTITIPHLGISSNCAITSGVVGCLVLRDTNLEKRSISYFSNPNNLDLSSYIDSNSCPQLLSQILTCSSLIVRATFSPQAPAQSLKCNIFSFCLFVIFVILSFYLFDCACFLVSS